MLAFVPTAVQVLESLARTAQSEAVRFRAAADILDRAGLKAADEISVVPADQTNAELDAALAAALARRAAATDA